MDKPIDFTLTRFVDRIMDVAAARGEPIPKRGTPEHRRLRAQMVGLANRKVWKFRRKPSAKSGG